MARSSWSWVAGTAAALTGSLDRRAAWPPRVRWPGAPHAGCCPAGSLDCLPPSRPGGAAAHRGRRRLAACPGTRPAAPGHQPPPGTRARCPRPPPGTRARCPRPPLVRAPCPSRCPRPGPGGMRYRARHLTIARCRPRWRPAAGGRSDAIPVARLPAPGPPGRGRGTGGRHLRFHRHGQVGLSPRHRRAARDRPRDRPRSCGDGPSGLGPVRHRLMSGCAVTGAGLSGVRFPWLPGARDLTGWPRGTPGASPGRPAWPGRVARWAAVWPLRAAVSPHRLSEPCPDFFESWRSSWSPVTESNRRSSPYHGHLIIRQPATT